MNAKTITLFLAAGALSALAAVAQPQKTREEVRGEAASAAKAGQIDHGEVTRVPPVASTQPRAAVKADTRAAVKAGKIDHGEVVSVPPAAPFVKTRSEVKAEAASAIRPARATRAASAASR